MFVSAGLMFSMVTVGRSVDGLNPVLGNPGTRALGQKYNHKLLSSTCLYELKFNFFFLKFNFIGTCYSLDVVK